MSRAAGMAPKANLLVMLWLGIERWNGDVNKRMEAVLEGVAAAVIPERTIGERGRAASIGLYRRRGRRHVVERRLWEDVGENRRENELVSRQNKVMVVTRLMLVGNSIRQLRNVVAAGETAIRKLPLFRLIVTSMLSHSYMSPDEATTGQLRSLVP